MDFEDILKEVGGFGLYQKVLSALFVIPTLMIVPMLSMNSVFYSSSPDHWCYEPNVASSNLSLETQQLLIRPPQDSSCSMYDVDYRIILESGNFTVDPNWPTKECDNGWQYDKTNYDATAVTKWNMVCKDETYNSLTLSALFFGDLLGTPFIGHLADKWGRKPTFLFIAFLSAVTNIGSALSPYFSLFLIFRVMNGMPIAMLYGSGFIIILELVSPEMRASINGIACTSWTLGLCLLPLIAYLTRNWVYLSTATALLAGSLLFYCKILPESPSWLISQGKYEEAAKIMVKISKTNGKTAHENNQILQKIEKLGEKIKKEKDGQKEHSPLDFIRYPTLRKRFLLVTLCWIGNSMPYYGLQMNITHLTGSEFINFFLVSLVEIPAHSLTWVLMERVGRRWCSVGAFLLSAVSCILPILFIEFASIGVVASLLAKASTSCAFMTLYQQGPELYPTALRGVGMGMSSTIGTGSTLIAPYVIYLGKYGSYIPFLVFSCISFAAAIFASFLPETLNKKLPQSVEDAENFEKNFKYFSCRAGENEKVDPSNRSFWSPGTFFTVDVSSRYVAEETSKHVKLNKLPVRTRMSVDSTCPEIPTLRYAQNGTRKQTSCSVELPIIEEVNLRGASYSKLEDL